MIKTNKDRADKIERLLGLRESCGEDLENEYYRVADVLCDLQHYCEINGKDFNEEMELAKTFRSWEIEIENE
jgi:hypothetical protein